MSGCAFRPNRKVQRFLMQIVRQRGKFSWSLFLKSFMVPEESSPPAFQNSEGTDEPSRNREML